MHKPYRRSLTSMWEAPSDRDYDVACGRNPDAPSVNPPPRKPKKFIPRGPWIAHRVTCLATLPSGTRCSCVAIVRRREDDRRAFCCPVCGSYCVQMGLATAEESKNERRAAAGMKEW